MQDNQTVDETPIALARLASALTSRDACALTGLSITSYERLEQHPLELTLGELKALSDGLNSDGRMLLQEWLNKMLFEA